IKYHCYSVSLHDALPILFSFCDCLNYLLEEDDIRRAFRQTYNGLREGGIFMFDVHSPAQVLAYAEEQPFIYNDDDVAYIWTCDRSEEHTSELQSRENLVC